ncbi:MAG: L,D-transpeptidase family protein [Dehalococcoidales bacterium]|nr:L,D-transpeptidase family protein [Dehalococcoidales bacterium]
MLRRLVLLAVTLVVVLGALPWTAGTADAANARVYVSESVVNVRARPSLSAPVVMKVRRGDPIIVRGTVSGQAVNGNSTWYVTKSGYYISDVVVSDSQSAATMSSRSGNWIDVNLSTLRANAMVGNQAVYTTPIAPGGSGWSTPTGTFRILSHTPSRDMDSSIIGIPPGSPGYYYVPNVPWIQYFTQQGDAIHGNYWSADSVFGNAGTSHGCVGMRVSDAKYFYEFGSVGMTVVIHY